MKDNHYTHTLLFNKRGGKRFGRFTTEWRETSALSLCEKSNKR